MTAATSYSVGGHVSAAGGLDKAIERAAAIGANCVQVFSGSPRVWARAPLSAVPVEAVFAKQAELSIKPIVTHAIYLTNLASDKPDLVAKSEAILKYDLDFDELVQGAGVVVHLGSHQGRGWDKTRDQVARSLENILKITGPNSHLLVENSAGQQGKLCTELADIAWLMEVIGSERLGWCVDTCHAHAAGYELGVGHKPEAMKPDFHHRGSLVEAIETNKLWSALRCVHVNDSRDEFGSGRDRHANLGQGQIPQPALAEFLAHSHFKSIPLILEVPGLDDQGPDAENINRLKALLPH